MRRDNYSQIRVARNLATSDIDVFTFLIQDGKRFQVTNMEVDEIKSFQYEYTPQLSLSDYEAQLLFDDLWKAGLRPQKPEEYAAKDEHLADLRKIAFHALGINSNSTSDSNSNKR